MTWVLGLGWAPLWASSAWGQAVPASSGTAWGTLQEAVDHAVDGDTITVIGALSGGLVTIDRDLTIRGSTGASYTSSAGALATTAGTLVVESLAITGTAGSGVDAAGDLVLRDVAVTGNAAVGGAVYARGASLVAERVDVIGATAVDYGGGFAVIRDYFAPGVASFTDVTIDGAVNGGIYAYAASVTCVRCTFRSTTGDEPALSVTGDVDAVVSNSRFEHTINDVYWLPGAVATGVDRVDISGTTVCGAGGGYAMRLQADGGSLRNNAFYETLAGTSVTVELGAWELTNNVFLGGGPLRAYNNLAPTRVAGNVFTDMPWGAIDESQPTQWGEIAYNAFDAAPATLALGVGNLDGVDPLLGPSIVDGDCDNDSVLPLPTSPLLDAGDPAVVDLDGSRSDIGITGGALADAALFVDVDGDGAVLLRDCADDDAGVTYALTLYADLDGDGVGDGAGELRCPEPGWVAAAGDCDDADPTVAIPGAYWWDSDGDGFGDPSLPAQSCHPQPWLASNDLDCDDADPGVNPVALELCDGIDQNCADGVSDEGTTTVYADNDGDGFGAGAATSWCVEPGWSANDEDCDDGSASVHPGAPELCNGIDDDCVNGVDEDVSTWFEDRDRDGYGDPGVSLTACEPSPGYVDNALDCDDQAPAVHPGAAETCDGADDDCNGIVDDGTPVPWYPDADRDGYGADDGRVDLACAPGDGWSTLTADCDDTDASVHPGAAEQCNGLDDDCDGEPEPWTEVQEWFEDTDGDGLGDPSSSVTSPCAPGEGWVTDGSDCDDRDPAVGVCADPPADTGDEQLGGDGGGAHNGPAASGGCGCDSGGASPVAGWALGVLALAMVQRRRAR